MSMFKDALRSPFDWNYVQVGTAVVGEQTTTLPPNQAGCDPDSDGYYATNTHPRHWDHPSNKADTVKEGNEAVVDHKFIELQCSTKDCGSKVDTINDKLNDKIDNTDQVMLSG